MSVPYIRYSSTTPTARLFFFDNTGAPITTLAFNTASFALSYVRDNGSNTALTLVTATLGTWVSSGFIHRGGGWYDLYLPTAATGTGAAVLQVIQTPLANVYMKQCIIPLITDDASAAAPTDATIMSALAGLTGASAREAIADTFLGRAIAGGSNSGRIVRDVFRAIRNKWTRSGSTITFTQEDDTTTAWTSTIATDSAAAPITGNDPA